ncbi:AAA family ATPase [Beggiatoa leptomitoformis]|uniref:AAA family ATPase n=1 Tax=Beggiatoa leptomitoformis TaxID=288004 RepID=A0A2N9YAK1_9GAMM|nr:AAA family ATPase [Beggiatoa leptomitoformis]ALG67117.1 AAA family ATPase [Beggiatoa leptomitoformis]AUI67488.1 AAA family ATPase [Beggiatoa leptomitoformis]
MYYEHFGLHAPPFKITPDIHLFYAGSKRGLVLEALIYAIKTGEGIVKVVGEVGSGKTMLCRMLETKLPPHIDVVYLANPHISPEMVLHAIAFEMRLAVSTDDNRLHVMHALHAALLEKHANHRQVVVFIEEAQAMPLDTLEEIRLLTNLETNRDKLLQMVLFGQPELDINLAKSHVRQLKERITHNFHLEPFTKQDIENYLYFRMQAVGYRGLPVFDKPAIKTLHLISQGLIRRVNILADKALLIAFMDNTHFVHKKHILHAAQDSHFTIPYTCHLPAKLLIFFLFALFMAIILSPQNQWLNTQLQHLLIENQTKTIHLPVTNPQPINNTFIQQRLAATQTWLQQVNSQHYTIQLLQINADKLEAVARFLYLPEVQALQQPLFIIKTTLGWILTYGEFTDEAQASAQLKTLPERLQRNKPFIRRMENLKPHE